MKAKLSLVAGIICISFSPVLVKLAVAEPIASAFYRMLIAWLALLPYCIIYKHLKITGKELFVASFSGVVFGADMAVWNISLLKISATISTLVANLAPVWVGLFSYLLWRKASGILFWLGTFICIIGMVVLVGYGNVMHLQFGAGILLALLSSVLYAVYIMLSKNILARLSIITFMFYSMTGAVACLFVMCKLQNNRLTGFPVLTWVDFAVMGLICQLLGWLTINYALRFLDSTRVSIALLGQTVLAGFLAILLLHEELALKEIAGSIVVLTGIAITFLQRRQLKNL